MWIMFSDDISPYIPIIKVEVKIYAFTYLLFSCNVSYNCFCLSLIPTILTWYTSFLNSVY